MKIGELSKRTGFNPRDIRKLIDMGILPQPTKVGKTQLTFGERHVEALENIARLQASESAADKEPGSPSRADANSSTQRTIPSLDKKKLIMDTAIALFSENGFENTKLSDITDSLGLGKGTFYLYFKNKKELLIECISQLSSAVVEKRESWEQLRNEPDFIRRQRITLGQFLKAFSTFNGIHILLASSLQSDDPEIVQKAIGYFKHLSGWLRRDLRRAINDKAVREVNTVIMSALMLGMAQGLGTLMSINPKYSIEQGMDVFLDLLEKGIVARKEERSIIFRWEVTDLSGFRVKLDNLFFDEKPHLSIELGQGKAQIPCEKISSLHLDRSDGGLVAEVAIDDGQKRTISVDEKIALSGGFGYGVYRVPLEKLATVFRIPVTENNTA